MAKETVEFEVTTERALVDGEVRRRGVLSMYTSEDMVREIAKGGLNDIIADTFMRAAQNALKELEPEP